MTTAQVVEMLVTTNSLSNLTWTIMQDKQLSLKMRENVKVSLSSCFSTAASLDYLGRIAENDFYQQVLKRSQYNNVYPILVQYFFIHMKNL